VAAEVKNEIRIKSYSFAQDSNAQDLVVATSIDNNATVVVAGYGSIMVDIVERLLQYGFNGRILCTPEFLVNSNLDSGKTAKGILEVMPDGFGFIRSANYLPGDDDIYVAPSQIRRFNLRTGDIIEGNVRVKTMNEKFGALLYIKSVNGYSLQDTFARKNFEDMTPIFPDEKMCMSKGTSNKSMRIIDLISPVGKGQRGMIVSPPKAGKTTLLKSIAKSIVRNNPEVHILILLIDERPEEVTDMKESIIGDNVEVIYSTFDEL